MTVLQIRLTKDMQKILEKRTKPVGISNTAYIKFLLAKDLGLLEDQQNTFPQGNLFNADRDNAGKGIAFSDVRKMLKD